MPDVDYDALPGWRWTVLKELFRSPLHCQHRQAQPHEDKKSFAMGRAGHCAILEPDEFPRLFALWDGARRAGKEWEAFVQANLGRTILSEAEYEACLGMRDAVRRHPVAKRYVDRGRAEFVLRWKDAGTALPCKARVDFLHEDIVLVDLKTSRDVDARKFAYAAAQYRYVHQVQFYREGLAANGLEGVPAKIVAVENHAPYDVAVFSLDEDQLWEAQNQIRVLMQTVADCVQTGEWPGQHPEERPLELPAWFYGSPTASAEALGLTVAGEEV